MLTCALIKKNTAWLELTVTLLLSDTVLSQPRVRYTECVYMQQVVFHGAEHHPSVHERNRLAHILD